MESCLYEGVVHHERLTPVPHRFRYQMYMAYLDLTELPGLIRSGLLSESRFGRASVLRRDHLGDAAVPLDSTVRDLVKKETGIAATGPVRLLTQLRTYGYYFSPLNLAYCFDADGGTLHAVVAMVQNTPWGERHCYVLWDGNREVRVGGWLYRHRKSFHVSPFMSMELEYLWRLNPPGPNLHAAIDAISAEGLLFRAGMHLRRHPLTFHSLRGMQRRHPFMTHRITGLIYLQAFQLWRKKCPFYPHPKFRRETSRASASVHAGN